MLYFLKLEAIPETGFVWQDVLSRNEFCAFCGASEKTKVSHDNHKTHGKRVNYIKSLKIPVVGRNIGWDMTRSLSRVKFWLLVLYVPYVLHTVHSAGGSKLPNILFLLADDFGWYDVGYHNPKIQTPNIDKLAKSGVILDSYYVQPICTPTRGALMTGRYPIHTGIVVLCSDASRWCDFIYIIPREEILHLTQFMKLKYRYSKAGCNCSWSFRRTRIFFHPF